MADVRCENHGSVFGFTPLTEDAREFFDTELATESWQWMGTTLMVEHRMVEDLFYFLTDRGFTIE